MKKKMIVLLAAALLALGASNAMAYFGDFELIRVVYNTATGDEAATDLGNVNTLIGNATASGSYTISGTGMTFNDQTGLGASADANLRVAYMAMDVMGGSNNTWLSASGNSPVLANTNMFTNLQSAINSFQFTYAGYGATVHTTKSGAPNNYENSFNPDGAAYTFNLYLESPVAEASLATLASGSVSQRLLFWADGSNNGIGANLAGSDTGITLLTNADGTTTLQAQAQTPIPAAAYLLGSGLMGLFGLRRKARA